MLRAAALRPPCHQWLCSRSELEARERIFPECLGNHWSVNPLCILFVQSMIARISSPYPRSVLINQVCAMTAHARQWRSRSLPVLLFTVCSATYEALFKMDANVLRAWRGSSHIEGERWVGRSGPQPRCIKLSAKVQAAKWAKFTSGSDLASMMESPSLSWHPYLQPERIREFPMTPIS